MHPVLFELGNIKVYSYGFMIALGAIAGVAYMVVQGKKEAGLSFDQANTLFLLIFIAAYVGGKFFLLLEDPAYYLANTSKLLTGRGFVFYGSFLFAVPTMLYYFRRNKLPVWKMLDVMAITTCLVHSFGRIGCFLAGCCYGVPTNFFTAVTFHDEACFAKPLHTPLHPTQLYEAGYILIVMTFLLALRKKRQFEGQLFLLYLLFYAVGRFFIEIFRGDLSRGYIIEDYLSHSQLIALLIFGLVMTIYLNRRKSTLVLNTKRHK
jgi:phosphatidylglycerol---prolipoprotein diacylglyceryl transferase